MHTQAVTKNKIVYFQRNNISIVLFRISIQEIVCLNFLIVQLEQLLLEQYKSYRYFQNVLRCAKKNVEQFWKTLSTLGLNK